MGSIDQIPDESAARHAVTALQIEINQNRKSIEPAITIGALVTHFQQRELRTGSAWRTFSTRNGYEGNLRKWIVPRWSDCINTVFSSLRGASCGAFLCPFVPTQNRGNLCKTQILIGVPDGI